MWVGGLDVTPVVIARAVGVVVCRALGLGTLGALDGFDVSPAVVSAVEELLATARSMTPASRFQAIRLKYSKPRYVMVADFPL